MSPRVILLSIVLGLASWAIIFLLVISILHLGNI